MLVLGQVLGQTPIRGERFGRVYRRRLLCPHFWGQTPIQTMQGTLDSPRNRTRRSQAQVRRPGFGDGQVLGTDPGTDPNPNHARHAGRPVEPNSTTITSTSTQARFGDRPQFGGSGLARFGDRPQFGGSGLVGLPAPAAFDPIFADRPVSKPKGQDKIVRRMVLVVVLGTPSEAWVFSLNEWGIRSP